MDHLPVTGDYIAIINGKWSLRPSRSSNHTRRHVQPRWMATWLSSNAAKDHVHAMRYATQKAAFHSHIASRKKASCVTLILHHHVLVPPPPEKSISKKSSEADGF